MSARSLTQTRIPPSNVNPDTYSILSADKNKSLKLNKNMDAEVLDKKLAERKTEMNELVKVLEECYGDLEGSKILSKCFLSAVHSIEELIDDLDARYTILKLILMLTNNLRNYFELAQKNVQKLKGEIEKRDNELKDINFVHELEKRKWEEKSKSERVRFENKPLTQQIISLKEKYNHLKITTEKEKKEMSNQIALLTVNNKKLSEKLNLLEESADIRKTTATIQKLNSDLYKAQEAFKIQKESHANSSFKLHSLLEATRDELRGKENFLLKNAIEYNSLLDEHKKLKVASHNNEIYIKRINELMNMTNEDIAVTKLKVERLNKKLKANEKVIEKEQKRISELEVQLKLQREGLVQKSEVSMQGTLFHFVYGDTTSLANNKNRHNSRTDKLEHSGVEESEKKEISIAEKIKETGEVKLHTISLRKYTYAKPTYRALIDHLLPQDITAKIIYSPPFPIWLHVTVRALFDSKATEIFFAINKGKTITRFPEFVFSWLGIFCVDENTRAISVLESTEREIVAKRNRCNLLLGLEAANAAKLWELSIFKEFLEEELGLDELTYFLYCRFILFKGPQLTIPTAGYCVTHFVSKERVNNTIDKVMYAYSPEQREKFKEKLARFSEQTYNDSNAFDYGMVLRVLLEFYRKEKKENFARFDQLYKIARPTFKGRYLSFGDFYKLIGEYDKSITDLNACNVYKEAFIGGSCSVNFESILLSLCETDFWVKYLRLKGQNLEPKYDARGDIDLSNDVGKECSEVYKLICY